MTELTENLLTAGLAVSAVGIIAWIIYSRVAVPARRKVRSLEAQIEHQRQQLVSPRAADLRPLIDALPDPMILTDDQHRITLVNAAAARWLLLPAASVVGKPFVSVVTDQALLELFDAARQGTKAAPGVAPVPGGGGSGAAGAAGAVGGGHMTAQREIKIARSGTRFVFQAVAVRNPGGAVLLLLRDVTQLAGIVQMKTDFVSNAGHELRTPVAAIKIAFETLREVLEEDPEQTHKCVTIIDGHIRRLEEMLRDLLDLSRVEAPDLQAQVRSIRAGEAFSMVAATLGPVAKEKGLDLRFEASAEDTPFATDLRLLNLVLKNLIENSIKFTPGGGRITVTLGPTRPGDAAAPGEIGQSGDVRRVALESATGGGAAATAGMSLAVRPDTSALGPGDDDYPGFTLVVSDTGIGIAPEHLDRVFERFYQVDPARTGSAHRGTGLGLAIVKHAVHALGGTIELESGLGRGTTVTCIFPPGKPAQGEAEAA